MTRPQAIERVRKLRQITVQHGATPHEAATASALAVALSERHGLARPAADRPLVTRYATTAVLDRRSARSLRFVAFA